MIGIKSILKALGGNIIKDVGGILDDVITSKEERMDAELRLTEAVMKSTLDGEQQLTDRHANDMKSDNWLAKSIRPLTLAVIVIFTLSIAYIDGNVGEITIKDHYVSLMENWGESVFIFYFGSRGVEKVLNTINQYKKKK